MSMNNLNEDIRKTEYKTTEKHERPGLRRFNFNHPVLSIAVSFLMFIFAGILVASLIYARDMFPTLARWLVFDLILAAMFLPFAVVIIIAYFFFRRNYTESGMYGGYFHRMFGKLEPAPPLSATLPLVPGKTTVTEEKNKYRLIDLITSGMLTQQLPDGMLMFQGYKKDETARYGAWPGTIAVTGMQNVGKSVTMLMLILIALYQGAYVVVCDTHKTKARSLYKKLVALTGIIVFATTEAEVLHETQRFSEELQARKNGSDQYPYVIFYDEFASLIRARNEELRKLLPTVIEEASQEGQGYNLNLVLAIHDLSNDGIGDAKIRSFLNWIYCHKMEAGQSKFIEAFNTRKVRNLIASLPKGHVVVRDEVNEIEYLIIPYGDSTDVLAAKKALYNVKQLATVSESISEPFQIVSGVSDRGETRNVSAFQHETPVSEQVKQLKGQGMNQTQIIWELWRVKPGASNEYALALAEYKHITASLE